MKTDRLLVLAVAAGITGCATGNGELPLMFGATNVVGVSIGATAADTGGEFVVGYKGVDLAVVPVSAVSADSEEFIGAVAGDGRFVDSYSVFGQFSQDSGRQGKGANAGLGKFFATGAAAQRIAAGFKGKMGVNRNADSACNEAPTNVAKGGPGQVTGAQAEPRSVAGRRAGQQSVMASQSAPSKAEPAHDGRQAARMIFAQYNFKALAIDGSALEQGIKLTLGYRDRNLALIPVVGRDSQGRIVHLDSQYPDGGTPTQGSDTLSVLGQFSSSDDASVDPAQSKLTIASGLEKFFATGAAARILSDGFRYTLCEEYAAPGQSATSPGRTAAR